MNNNNELMAVADTQVQQSLAITEATRSRAQIEAAMTVAQARPRDESRAIDKIANSCQRQSLAERAVYQFSKGGTDISGPSIALILEIARCWENLDYGFRELSRRGDESTVEVYAWDMESNTRYVRTFIASHKQKRRGKFTVVGQDEVDYWIANQAQRRVRTCLENVLPRDVIEEAVEECQRTLATKVDVNATTIKAMLERFAEFGVTPEQIAARIQRKLEAMTPAQYLMMRRIFNSMRDGMSTSADWFPVIEDDTEPAPAEQADTGGGLAERLQKKGNAGKTAKPVKKRAPKRAPKKVKAEVEPTPEPTPAPDDASPEPTERPAAETEKPSKPSNSASELPF